MRIVDVIARKRDGHALTDAEVAYFVGGVTDGTWPLYQASALLMAILLRGMTREETFALTQAMVRSGERIDLSDVPGVKVGKHSTGGVGDKVSIVLAPLVAACGGVVPKMSGRGLGHTGGTLDKLESIPGFRIDLSIEEFKEALRDVGTCIVGQTKALVPADKKLYALRDVTATVESIPLVAASIMSKKLAEGSNALVLDVKCGHGAFMKDAGSARDLAQAMVDIGTLAGIRTEAMITDMDAPLGRTVGNALEIVECVEVLRGNGPTDVATVVRHIACRMLVLGQVTQDETSAGTLVDEALASGRALDRFRRMIERQGGNPRVVDDVRLLPAAPSTTLLRSPVSGYLTRLRAESIGRASNALGAGRNTVDDVVDHAAGIRLLATLGERIDEGQPLLELHHRESHGLEMAMSLCREAIEIGDAPPPPTRKVLAHVQSATEGRS